MEFSIKSWKWNSSPISATAGLCVFIVLGGTAFSCTYLIDTWWAPTRMEQRGKRAPLLSLRYPKFHIYMPFTQLIFATQCNSLLRFQLSSCANLDSCPQVCPNTDVSSELSIHISNCLSQIFDWMFSMLSYSNWEYQIENVQSEPILYLPPTALLPRVLGVIEDTTGRSSALAKKLKNYLCFSIHVQLIHHWVRLSPLPKFLPISLSVLWFRILTFLVQITEGDYQLDSVSSFLPLLYRKASPPAFSKMRISSIVSPAKIKIIESLLDNIVCCWPEAYW